MKILTKIYHQKVDCRAELIEIGISEHGTFSSDSIENKVHNYNQKHCRNIAH